ncbi:MAG: lysylphosphatidylglycerol synthase domain-containing protein, partial [Dongiaceae bacterium]
MAWSMKRRELVALVIGGAIAIALLWSFDPRAVAASVTVIGWGLFVICLYRLSSIACDAMAWGCLMPAQQRPGLLRLFGFRWMAKSINTFLPAMQVGGDLLRVHMLWCNGLPVGTAGASVLVDATLNLAAQIAFT